MFTLALLRLSRVSSGEGDGHAPRLPHLSQHAGTAVSRPTPCRELTVHIK